MRKALLKTEKERAKEPERRGRKPKLSKARVTGGLLAARNRLESGSVWKRGVGSAKFVALT